MINVTKIAINSFDLDRLDIYWEIAPVGGVSTDAKSHVIYDYQFLVLRSESAMGPFEPISGPLRDQYSFRDDQVSMRHKWRQYYYKIRVTYVPTSETLDFGPAASNTPEPDLITIEIIRQEDVLFRKFVGRKCFLFNKRTFGPSCTCYDSVLKRRTRGAHPVCFDTGWFGGFLSPIQVYVQIDPYPKASRNIGLTDFMENDTSARMISFPPICPGDILVESENKRWRVMQVASTERLRAIVRQELRIHEIPKGDIEYALPINIDASTLEPASEDNFKNKSNIETDGDYEDIFAIYGHPRGSIS